ncbi:hypothetical protein Plhal703r1_c39g0137321 [Plasmopara halstedii]
MHAGVNRKLKLLEAVQFAIAGWEEVPLKCAAQLLFAMQQCRRVDNGTTESGERLWSRVRCERGSGSRCADEEDDVIERVGLDANQDLDNDLEAEAPIRPSATLACCVKLAEFIARHSNYNEKTRALAKVAEFAR